VKSQEGNIMTIVSIAVVVSVIVFVVIYLILSGDSVEQSSQTVQTDPDTGEVLPSGSYVDFSNKALAEAGDDTKVIFFRADWCPECLAFERNLNAMPIPDGLTIFKADYDRETALKKKYGVRHQTTFVQVDLEGNQITKWQGFGADDVNIVLENIIKEN